MGTVVPVPRAATYLLGSPTYALTRQLICPSLDTDAFSSHCWLLPPVLLLTAIEVILHAPGPSQAHCCLLQTRHLGSPCPLARLHLIPDNHAKIPPLSFFTGRMPFLPPNQQRQSTEGISTFCNCLLILQLLIVYAFIMIFIIFGVF